MSREIELFVRIRVTDEKAFAAACKRCADNPFIGMDEEDFAALEGAERVFELMIEKMDSPDTLGIEFVTWG